MKRAFLISLVFFTVTTIKAQNFREFRQDTATFIAELQKFSASGLQERDQEDFNRFINLWDSLPYERQMEVIEISNLMLDKRCRPRPHFIGYQRVMLEFWTNDRIHHGYDDWVMGYKSFLKSEDALLQTINQFLEVTYLVLSENALFRTNVLSWIADNESYTFKIPDNRLRIEYENVTLTCVSRDDSIQLRNATGYIDPFTLQWNGRGGKVDWIRAGYTQEEMYAVLRNYKFDLRKLEYKADSAILYYPGFFDTEVMGRLEDKVSQIKDPRQAKYPQFYSYQSSYRINQLVPGVNFRGGLYVQGANLAGYNSDGEPAELDFYSEDTLRIRLKSDLILFNERTIQSAHSTISIYLGKDSIYHPDLILNYNIAREEARFSKSDKFTSTGPYANSYHNIDMNFDELYWSRNDPKIKLQALTGTSIGRATFESATFFNYDFYMSLQGMDYEHPLVELWSFSNYVGGRTFSVLAFASSVGYAAYQVRHQLMTLSKLGFVFFDDETDLVTLRQKLFDYIDSSIGQRDYDVIRFVSRTESNIPNGILDIHTKDLEISGIPVIFLSDSQNVRLIPEANRIVMKRNRNFQFDGIIDAGLFRFFGHNFFFDYDRFKINLQNIDSLQLSVLADEKNQYGEQYYIRIDNKIELMTGELLIDEPNNKSGLRNFPEYPTFTSKEKSYIFFDEASIQKGVYKRDNFYFELYSFVIDSLDNYRRESVKLDGTFISANILPPMEMEMTLRDDNSLGFFLTTPAEGIPLYGGAGTFYNDIEMSSRGLHGYGSLNYLTSTTFSDDFVMHPDSMFARSRQFLLREQMGETEFPHAENTVADMTWYPESDKMRLDRVKETFKIINDSTFLAGNLLLSSEGLSGEGVMAIPDARLESKLFNYDYNAIRSDSAGVKLKKGSDADFAFQTDDVNLNIDFSERKGNMTANKDYTLVEFPKNMYETRLDNLTWYMDREEVEMRQKKYLPEFTADTYIDTLRRNGPSYVSKHPNQDSLHFIAPVATYNYNTKIIRADSVPFIRVADAYIFPRAGEVSIGQMATISQLTDAQLLANDISKRYFLYDADLFVDGRLAYHGSGTYNYRDEFDNVYPIRFNRIEVDTSLRTIGRGTIAPKDSFMLSPYFAFQGEVKMFANEPYLNFDGGARVVHDCKMSKEWLRFTSIIKPEDVKIPVGQQMQNVALNKIFAGTMITRDSTHIYSTFLSGRKDYFDSEITTSSGWLTYSKERESYELASEEKLLDSTRAGEYLRLETANCTLFGEGPVNLNLDYGQVKLTTAGNTIHRIGEDLFTANLLMGLDFFISKEALAVMGREIDSLPNLEPADLSSYHYQLGMRNLVGEDLSEKLERELGLYGVYSEIPAELKHTLFISSLPLKWVQETRSFRYNGKIDIANIGDIQVNKRVNAYIEFVEKGSGDIFDIYLQVDRNTWYYIAYSPGGLQVLSSNRNFNKIVFDLNANDRKLKVRPGQTKYVYSLAAERRLDLFKARFLDYERSIEEEPDKVY